MDDLDEREISQLILASEELALRSAITQRNIERASARLAVLLDQIDARHNAVLAMLQVGVDMQHEEVEQLIQQLTYLSAMWWVASANNTFVDEFDADGSALSPRTVLAFQEDSEYSTFAASSLPG